MKKKILLIGGRSKARSLAESLMKQDYSVTVINDSYEICRMLAEIKGLSVICGDGTKPFILDEAGAADCDISIALTATDEDNLVASELCKQQFGVRKTVSLVSDPKKTAFFRQMGVDSVVCAISAITNIIEHEAFLDEITNFIPLGEGRVQIVEVQIMKEAPADGKMVWEIPLPKQVIIGCILRYDTTLIPRGDTRILAGDTLVLLSAQGQEMEAVRALTGRE